MKGPTLILGALLALPLAAATPALAKSHHHKHQDAQKHQGADGTTNSVAYPKAPGGAPAAGDKGKPVEPVKDGGGDKPAPSDKAGTEGATSGGGVRTPTTSYPGSPVETPAATDAKGTPPK